MSEILKSPTRNHKKQGAFLLMFSDIQLHLEIFSTTITLDLCDYPCGKCMHCQMCGRYFKKKFRKSGHLKKKTPEFVWSLVKDIKISKMIEKIQNSN